MVTERTVGRASDPAHDRSVERAIEHAIDQVSDGGNSEEARASQREPTLARATEPFEIVEPRTPTRDVVRGRKT